MLVSASTAADVACTLTTSLQLPLLQLPVVNVFLNVACAVRVGPVVAHVAAPLHIVVRILVDLR